MSIETVFRIRCDACRRWLSLPEDYVPGTDCPDDELVLEETAVRAVLVDSATRAVDVSRRANMIRTRDGLMCLSCTAATTMADLFRCTCPTPRRVRDERVIHWSSCDVGRMETHQVPGLRRRSEDLR